MKNFLNTLIVFCFILVGTADAAQSGVSASSSLLVWFFIGFIALFIVSQLIPSVILLVSLTRGIFSTTDSDRPEQTP